MGGVVKWIGRVFEKYVIDKMNQDGKSNDYLANIVNEKDWSRDGSYPYPTDTESVKINKAFDSLFDTIEVKDGEMYSEIGNDALVRKDIIALESLRSCIG